MRNRLNGRNDKHLIRAVYSTAFRRPPTYKLYSVFSHIWSVFPQLEHHKYTVITIRTLEFLLRALKARNMIWRGDVNDYRARPPMNCLESRLSCYPFFVSRFFFRVKIHILFVFLMLWGTVNLFRVITQMRNTIPKTVTPLIQAENVYLQVCQVSLVYLKFISILKYSIKYDFSFGVCQWYCLSLVRSLSWFHGKL